MLHTFVDRSRRATREDGFSLVEVLMVAALAAVLGGMAIGISGNFVTASRSDSSTMAITKQLEMVRNRAVAERRNFEVRFILPDRIQIARQEVPGPVVTIISTNALENGLTFQKYTGLPDTPDKFGNATPVAFSGPGPVMFTSDGSMVDSNGDVTNGTILLGEGNRKESARALTIFGVTGLIRHWKWVGTAWGN